MHEKNSDSTVHSIGDMQSLTSKGA